MPSETHGDDAHREPEVDSASDATQATPEVGPSADRGPDGDPQVTQPGPEVSAGPGDETTGTIRVAEDDDTDELPVAPTVFGAPPVDDAPDTTPTDQGHRNRRRALIATLVVAILALVGLGAAILATEGDEPADSPTSSSSSTTASTVPSTTAGLTPGPSGPTGTTQTTEAPTTTVPPTTTTQPTTTTAPTTTTTATTTTTTSTSTDTSTTTAPPDAGADTSAR
jgi:hypothetical protein